MRNAGGTYIAMGDQDTTVSVVSGQLAVFNPETWFMYSAYKKGEDIEKLILLRVKQAIRLQVTALYLSCLSLESSSQAINSSVDQAGALLKEMEALYREGFVVKSDLEKARVFMAMQENNLSEMERMIKYTKSQLLESMGLSPFSEITLGGTPSLPVRSRDLSDMIHTAMLNRPELMISDRNVTVREDAVKMALLAFLPKIFLVGDLTSNRDSYLKYRDIFTSGISAVLTIFDGFSNIYEYKAAKQERSKAMLEREQSCLKIILEVIKAKQSLDREDDNRTIMKLELDASRSRLNEVMSLWKEGMMTSSEKLNAVSLNTAAEANMAMAEYRYQVALATMADVMGISGKE
jgi:outer membrane protein TolC